MNGYEAVKAALHTKGISPTQKLVLAVLADHVDNSGACHPGIKRLMNLTGFSRQAVCDAIGALETAGLIAVLRYHGKVNQYRLLLGSQPSRLVNLVDQGSQPSRPLVVNLVDHTSQPSRPEQNNIKPTEQNKEQSEPPANDSPYWQIPPALETADFIRAWHSWLTYANERRLPFTETQAVAALAELEGLGPERATKAIRYSIKRSYRSIYEEKQPKKQQTANGAESAWSEVWTGNQFVIPSDEKAKAAIKRMGGMSRLRATQKQDLDWLRKEFIREYDG